MAKIEELKGFCYPLSPEGKCSLLGNPPWHYGTEYLNIAYREIENRYGSFDNYRETGLKISGKNRDRLKDLLLK